MWGLRLGDDVDDFCTKCKRLTNHVVLSIVDERPAKVRCRTCYHEQDYRECIAPPTRKELKQAELLAAALGESQPVDGAPAPAPATKVAKKK